MRVPLLALALLPLALTACSDDDPAPSARSATPSGAASLSPSPSLPPSPEPSLPGIASSATLPQPSPDLAVRLIGDGVDLPDGVVVFGDAFAQAQPRLLRFLGRPSKDTGTIEPFSAYGTCPGEDLRVLEYGDGALVLLFGTPTGGARPELSSWTLTGAGEGLPRARALVGDVTTFEFGPGTTLAELQDGAGETLQLLDDELTGPAFRVEDQSGGFYGTLTSSGPDAEVERVQAGEGCGE